MSPLLLKRLRRDLTSVALPWTPPAYPRAALPAPVAAFVRATLQTAMQGDLDQVLGSFFYGRETIIPGMFRALSQRWDIAASQVPLFGHYLERPIAVDAGAQGRVAGSLIQELVGEDPKRQEALLKSALAALRQREHLWSALFEKLQPTRELLSAQ